MSDEDDDEEDLDAYEAVPGFTIPIKRVREIDEMPENPDGSRTGSMFMTIEGCTFDHGGVKGFAAASVGAPTVIVEVGNHLDGGSRYIVDVRDMIRAATAAHVARISGKPNADVYHYFQCLNPDCGERAMVDVRCSVSRTCSQMACPFCYVQMDYGGQAAENPNGYDTRKVRP